MSAFNVTIGQYVKGDSYLHKLDPRFKILATIIFMIAIFLIPSSLINVYYLLGFVGLFVVLLLLAKINLLAILKGLQPVLFIGLFTFVLQIIYNPTGTLIKNLEFNISFVMFSLFESNVIISSLSCVFSLEILSNDIFIRFNWDVISFIL